MRAALVCLLLLAVPAAADDYGILGVHRTGPLHPGDSLRVVHQASPDTTLWAIVSKDGYLIQSVPRTFTCTAPCSLENGQPAHSWQTLRLYAYPRKLSPDPTTLCGPTRCWLSDSGWVRVDSVMNCPPCSTVVFHFNDTSGGRWTTFEAQASNGAGTGRESNYSQ